jgi:hypothetical protein
MSTSLGDKILRDQDPKNNDFGQAFKEISDSVAVTARGSYLTKDDSSGVHKAIGGTGEITVGTWKDGGENSVGYVEFSLGLADLGLQDGSKDSTFRDEYDSSKLVNYAWIQLPNGSDSLTPAQVAAVSVAPMKLGKQGAQRINLSDTLSLGPTDGPWVRDRDVDITPSRAEVSANKEWKSTARLFLTKAGLPEPIPFFGYVLQDSLDTLMWCAQEGRRLTSRVDSLSVANDTAVSVRNIEGDSLLNRSKRLQDYRPTPDSAVLWCKAYSSIVDEIMHTKSGISPIKQLMLADLKTKIAGKCAEVDNDTLQSMVSALDDSFFRGKITRSNQAWYALVDTTALRDARKTRKVVLGFAVQNHSDSTAMRFWSQANICRPKLCIAWGHKSDVLTMDTINVLADSADYTVSENTLESVLAAQPISSWGSERSTEIAIDFGSMWDTLEHLPPSALLDAHVKVTVDTLQNETPDTLGFVFRVNSVSGTTTDSLTAFVSGSRIREIGQTFQIPVKQFLLSGLKAAGTHPTAYLKISLASPKSTLGKVRWSVPGSTIKFEAVLATSATAQE